MQISSSAKYEFRIRTRSGAVVDNLLIFGQSEPDAERKLRQIYVGCEIIETRRMAPQAQRNNLVSYEDVVDLITDMPG